MKSPLAVAVAVSWMATAAAQEFVAPKPPAPPPIVPVEVERRPTVEGIVKEIFDTRKPWQLVNPLAPKEYGNGEKTVAYSEHDPGKPKGFIVFAVEW